MANWARRLWREGNPPGFWEGFWLFALTCAFVLVLASGDSNGIGYFQAEQGDLLLPLALGSLINLAIFLVATALLLPRLRQQRSMRAVLWSVLVLVGANILLQTLVQLSIIAWRDTYLQTLSIGDLALENIHAAVLTLVLAFIYRAGRDWLAVRLLPAGADNSITFGEGNNQVRLPIREIRHIKSAGNYLEVTTRHRMTLVYGALKDAESALAAHGFVRIHRSWIVNLAEVRQLTASRVTLDDGALPVGASFAKSARDAWLNGATPVTAS